MTSIRDHQSAQVTKMLFIGDSGAGKTGALASLAADYKLRIIDCDAGLDVLANILRDPKSPYGPKALDNVEYITLTDRMRNVNGRMVPGAATVWQRAMVLFDTGKAQGTDGDKIDWGPLATWDSDTILVIDSLTMISMAAMNFVLSMNARLGQRPHQSDWYDAQLLVEGMLQQFYDAAVRCNIIVISHITYLGEENGPTRGYPNTLGKALPPKVGTYFNTALMAKTSGSGTALKRMIHTTNVGVVELKNTNPTVVKATYPIETGLLDYFRAVRGASPRDGAPRNSAQPTLAVPPPATGPVTPLGKAS